MLCGAYTLAQNAHVRGDFLYSSMRPRTQAALDLVLYIVFFLPGIAALVYAGYYYAADSWRINEHSNVTADGPPVYHFKSMIPIAGALMHAAGRRRDRALRRLPEDRRMAEPAQGRRRDRRRRGAAGAQRIRRRGIAQDRDREAQRHRRNGAPARHGRRPAEHERSGTRPADAGAHRRRHHDGLSHGLHADGPRHVLRLHRLLRPGAGLGATTASST